MVVLNRLLNLRNEEGAKVLRAFSVNFCYRVGFVMGWTVLVAMFVGYYGIGALPYLLILNALFTVLGSAFYAILLKRFSRERVLLISLLVAVGFLLVARMLFEFSVVWCFAFLIAGLGVFITQIRILLGGAVEEMFTALQASRVFPIVESADTLGGIVAGVILLVFSEVLASEDFVFLWIFALLVVVGILLFVRGGSVKGAVVSQANILTRFREKVVGKKQFGFFKTLVAIVFLQWFLFNMMDFQYTVAVFESASETVMDAGSGFEHAFIHDLGVVFILFSFSALLVQLLVGSRIISALGVVGTLFLHALVTFVSAVGLIFSFGFPMAVFARNNFTMTTVLHLNAYHSAYYAFKASFREDARELIDGIVRPCGALFGSLLILGLKFVLPLDGVVSYVSILMLLGVIAMFYFISRQQRLYTEVALEVLLQKGGLEGRLNAADILAQKGHSSVKKFLRQVADDENEPEELREKIKSVILAKY